MKKQPETARKGEHAPTIHVETLEYFVAVGEAGSIAKAAEQVNVSPPSISASIAQLETEFGIELFVRKHSHGLSLTGGRIFLKAASKLLSDADALHDVAGDISDKVRGPLAIGCLLTFAQIVLPSLRQKFEREHPEVRIGSSNAIRANCWKCCSVATSTSP